MGLPPQDRTAGGRIGVAAFSLISSNY